MGNKITTKTQLASSQKNTQQQFSQCYKKCHLQPTYLCTYYPHLEQHLHENITFGKNMIKMFPNYRNTYNNFLDMIHYYTKYDFDLSQQHLLAKNIKKTTLLDRFFMTCLDITNWQEYQKIQFSTQSIEDLLGEYMNLFLKQPKKGYIHKILNFIQIKTTQKINVKIFADHFRQHFPHVQKYLRDYINAKIKQDIKDAHLLKNMKSTILKQDAIFLALRVPKICSRQASLLYCSETGGLGFHSIERKIIGYTGPWLMLIQHSQKNQNGQKIKYIFGTYQNGPIRDTNMTQGDLTGFLFSIQPNIRFMTTDKGQGGTNYFYLNNIPEQVSKKRKGFGFGGNEDRTNFKLWIDEDIDKSKVFNGNDKTYGFGKLAGSGTQVLRIDRLQIWGLGGEQCLKQQELYWRQRQQEISKRRKVNKKQLLDSNAGMFFGTIFQYIEKTFAHRQQVVGQIQRHQKKQFQSQK